MSADEVFFDTNVLLYLLSDDAAKADRAESLLAQGGTISVQVLNEFASVASRRLQMSWPEIREVLDTIQTTCQVVPLSLATHQRGAAIAERYRFSFYDATIVAAAQLAGCTVLYSEDMQDGQVIEGRLTVRNPFSRPVIARA
jgi:predicted nucleic acid-binding protein